MVVLSTSGKHIDSGLSYIVYAILPTSILGPQGLSTMNGLQLRDAIFKREYGNPYLSPRGMQGLVVSVVFTSLAASFVGIRLYTRLKFLRRLEANDWMVVIALVRYKIPLDIFDRGSL